MYRPPTYHPSPVQRGGWYHSHLLMVYIGNRTNATIGGRGIKEVMLWQVIREIDDAYATIMIFGGNGKEVSYWRGGAGVKSQVTYGYWNLGPAVYSSVDGEEKKGWRLDNIHDPCTHLSLPTDLVTTAAQPSPLAQPLAPSMMVPVSFSCLLAGVKVWCSAPSMYCTPHLVEVAKRASGNEPTPRLQNKLQMPQEEDRGGWPSKLQGCSRKPTERMIMTCQANEPMMVVIKALRRPVLKKFCKPWDTLKMVSPSGTAFNVVMSGNVSACM